MSTLKGNLKLLNSNINVQEKKKIWLDTIKDDPICLKGCDYKSLKSIALTFFKDKNLYNEENLVILNFFCKEKLDDFLLNDEIMEFLQKTYLLYEYFIKEGCDKINKKQFIENISECCKRIFLKNIIKHEKEILDFLLKNLMNYINKYSFCLIYQSLYNIYQYNQNNYNQIYYVKQNPTFEFLLCLENKKINNEVLLINNNKFAIDSLFVLNENDEKGIREYFEKNGNVTICDAYRERENTQEDEGYKNYNYESDKNNDIVEYVNDNKKEQRGTILRTKQSTSSNDKNISKNLESLNKEFSCFYLFIYFKSCFENINFYLIEKFIENYYINHNNENIYKELLLFLFLIYKDKMNTLVDRILTDSINYLNNNYTASIINNNDSNNNHNNIYHKSNSSNRSYSKNYSHNHLESHKKQKRNTNENIKERNKELYLSDCLFYYELLINIIIYKNLNYENNYEYYLNFIKTLHDNDTFQEMFLSSFFFVYISTNDVSIRNVLLTNFIKYGSKRFSTLSKLFTSIKRIFYIIYHDIVDEMYIYNNKLFTNIPGQYSIRRNEILDTDEKELNYLNFVKNNNNICIDKYICLFFKEVYYIISRTNMEYFALVTHLYLYTYDYIFQKIINVIYENEMNLNDTSFDICKQVLKPFLFLYVDIFDSFIEALKKNVYSEKVMITYSFIKKYLFKNMYEKSFLQKDLFYVIYHIYFLQYVLKYNFLNFLTNFITTKRNVSQYLENFLKLKEEHMKEIDATLEKNGNYENQKEILNEKEILDENENLNEKEILDVNENLNEKEVLDEKQNNHDMLEDDKKIKKLNNEKDDKVEKAQRTKRTESKYGGNKKGYYNEDDSSDDDNSDDEEWDDYKHIKSYRNGRNKKQENNNNNNNKKRKKANDKNKNNVEKMDVIDLSCSDKESEEERYRKKKKDSKKDIKSDDNNNKNDDENDNKNNYNNNIQNNNMYNKNNNNSSSFLNNDDPELLCDKMSEEEGQKNKCVNNVVDAEKERIISFFEKNYLVLKYFTSYTDDMIFGHDESYITSLDDYIDIKEHTKLKRISNNMKNMNKSNNNNNNNNNENDNQHNNNNNNSSSNYNYIGATSDDKSRFIRKLHSFYNKKRNVDNTINELFLNNKDNVYSKILKNNLSIIKELRNLRMDILYPIFNASLVFLFDDFYFFIIQNIKLVIEEKEKFYYDHKIFLNTSLILLHCLSKDVKIEKYLVSIFYILKLSFNKLKSIEIINEGIHQNKDQIYDKNTKTFQNNVKYYNIKKDKDIVTSYVACHKKNNDDHENNNKNITLNELEENIKLYQNVFYIFLKLLQNISKTNNLYYNFKFIIYDILFSPYSNKKIIFSCMKCILDRSKLDEIYNYCLNVLDKIKMDENIIEELLNVEDNISHNNNNMVSYEYNKYNSDLDQENDINQNNKGYVKNNINYNIQHNNSNNFNNDEHFKHISLKNINETYIKENNYLPLILYNKNNIGNSFFFNDIEKNSKSREISSLYINILILYYIITQKEKTNKKTTYCDNYLKFDIDNCSMIINKLICLLHTNNDFNSSYYKYIKYLSFKTFKKIYSYLSIKEADIYTGHIKNKSTEDIINEDKKLNDIKVLKLEILEYFYIISNKEIKEYIMKNKKSNNTKQNNLSTYSDEYRFFFSNNLNCNNIILKNDNFYFMINSLLFIFNMKYDKATFYKLITIILMEKNEYKNYVLEKIIPSIKKFFKLSYIINNVKRENKKQNLKLSNDIMNHSVLLYIIRTIIILFLLIDYNHINKHNIIINENYISYHMFINDYIKKKSLKYYYTQLNFLLFRIFYNEKNLSYFFKMFFTTLYIISFKKKGNENMMFFFEKIFHLNILDENVYSSTNKRNKLLKNTMNVQENHQIVEDMKKFKEENEEDNNNPNFVHSEEEKQNYNKKNKNSVENSGKNIVGTHKQRKNKSVNKSEKNTKYNKGYNTDDNSTENDTNDNNNTENDTNDNNTENDTNDNNTENNTDSNTEDHSQDSHSLYSSDEEVRKNYREILRSHKKNDGGLNKKCIKYKSTVRSNGSTTSSSNDSDDTFRIRINKKRKNKNTHNKKKKQQKNEKRNSSSLDDNLITYVEQKSQRTNSSNEMKYTQTKKSGKKEYILNQQQMKPFTDNIMEKMEKEMNIENFQFNGSLSVKILNHLIFLCKGFHEDLELKIYNGIKSCLKDNEMDKEKLKHLLEQNIKEDQHIHSHGSSIKYKKKLELLKMIDTKIIFLTYIKDNLEKRKSLVSRMSELNLNIFKNKSMFHIDIDFI
ncbi:conserved Plasmodium protein, unknown function [Plasmodium sp. gorilla clade G2]|uniref:conserved Plasmodium protein, unknown function n=1 Tax=Plasmodium sp. gorilla clade G2 TaxID=880535 RepID=UPI000D211CEE|nr:conserved Plasmodium protein, unknown function [Plasmodium sp. gorilla clade G2]SOV14780.1 conserved Plasmodium protein, unknown function [Plasmodium sp. gorilla clade G2]